jgi:hypothetical protein
MDPILLDDIPGLKEARERATEREHEIRRGPFLPLPKVIAGVSLLPMTLRHYVHLDAVGSPFLIHEFGALEDVLQFLWLLSPDYVQPSPRLRLPDVRKRRAAFLRKIKPRAGRCVLGRVCKKIRALVEETLFECPKPGRRRDAETRSIAHIAACLVDEFAGKYGWPDEILDEHGQPDRCNPGIMDKPLGRLFQYRRCRTARENPGAEQPNPLSDGSDRIQIQKFNQRQAKKAKRSGPSTHPE